MISVEREGMTKVFGYRVGGCDGMRKRKEWVVKKVGGRWSYRRTEIRKRR